VEVPLTASQLSGGLINYNLNTGWREPSDLNCLLGVLKMITKAIKCDWCKKVRTFPSSMSAGKARDIEFHKLGWRHVRSGNEHFDFCGRCVRENTIGAMLDDMQNT